MRDPADITEAEHLAAEAEAEARGLTGPAGYNGVDGEGPHYGGNPVTGVAPGIVGVLNSKTGEVQILI